MSWKEPSWVRSVPWRIYVSSHLIFVSHLDVSYRGANGLFGLFAQGFYCSKAIHLLAPSRLSLTALITWVSLLVSTCTISLMKILMACLLSHSNAFSRRQYSDGQLHLCWLDHLLLDLLCPFGCCWPDRHIRTWPIYRIGKYPSRLSISLIAPMTFICWFEGKQANDNEQAFSSHT